MPIYEYACRACGVETEIMHKISDPPVRKCPACGKLKLTKQVSAGGFRLTGGGWYETDFKKDGKRNIAGDKADAPAAKPADAGKTADKATDKSADKNKTEKKEPAKKEAAKETAKADAKKPAKAA